MSKAKLSFADGLVAPIVAYGLGTFVDAMLEVILLLGGVLGTIVVVIIVATETIDEIQSLVKLFFAHEFIFLFGYVIGAAILLSAI